MGARGSNRGGRSVVVGGWLRREAWRDVAEGAGEKPRIKHRIVAVRFALGVLLAIDFDGARFLCNFLGIQWLKALRGMFYWLDQV
jgi:hypothetical protein